MYNCPICNQPFELGTKFCSGCGCNLEETFIENPICPICHRKFPAGSIYCTEDGTKLVSPDKPKSVIRPYLLCFYYYLLPFVFYKASNACFLLEIARYYSQK